MTSMQPRRGDERLLSLVSWERVLLGAVMLGDGLVPAASIVEDGDWLSVPNRKVWKACRGVYRGGNEPCVVLVLETLSVKGWIDDDLDERYLVELVDAPLAYVHAERPAAVEAVAKLLHSESEMRREEVDILADANRKVSEVRGGVPRGVVLPELHSDFRGPPPGE